MGDYYVVLDAPKENGCENMSSFTFDPEMIYPKDYHETSITVTPSPDYSPKITIPECDQISNEYKTDEGTTFICVIGKPEEGIYQNGNLSVLFESVLNEVQISSIGKERYSNLAFSLNPWQKWTTILHENNYDSNAPASKSSNKVMMDVVFEPGTSCGYTSGKFEILEFVWTPANYYEKDVQRLALNFEQTCDSGTIYRGYVRYQSTVNP